MSSMKTTVIITRGFNMYCASALWPLLIIASTVN